MSEYREFLKACAFYHISEEQAKFYWFMCSRNACTEIIAQYRKEVIKECTQ